MPKKPTEEEKRMMELLDFHKPPRVGGIPQPPKLGVSGYAGAKRGGPTPRSAVPRAPVNLENVKPVTSGAVGRGSW